MDAARTHPLTDLPDPDHRGWVADVVGALGAGAAGLLVLAPLGPGPGTALVLGGADGAPGHAPGGPLADGVRVGPAQPLRVRDLMLVEGAPEPACAMVTTFAPRDEGWLARQDRAGRERLWPAVRHVDTLAGVLTCSTPEGTLVTWAFAGTVEALEEAGRRITTTALLPWEDRGELTGPESVVVQRVLHARLPVPATVTP